MDQEKLSQKIESTLARILDLLGFSATIQVDVSEAEDRKYFEVRINVSDNASELIGNHGRNLEALTTVLNMLIPDDMRTYSILLDINGYRDERVKYIQDLTKKAIAQVKSSGQPVELLPMKPWERRVVHMSVVDSTDIMTESIGDGSDRRVVIKTTAVF